MRAWVIASLVCLSVGLAACGSEVQPPPLVPAPAIVSDRSEPVPLAMSTVTRTQAAPLQLPAEWTAPAFMSEFDDPKTAPYWRAPDRYSEIVRTWDRYRLVEVVDQECKYSHVRVEFDGILQFLTRGCSGYGLRFYDSEDFYLDGDGPETHRPPQQADAETWRIAGRASDLIVEDLTGTGGATLILQEWTGGNHVYRQTTFLHLGSDGRVETFGPFRTAMYVTYSRKLQEDIVFTLHDGDWYGWDSCMAGSPSPEVNVSLKGGTLHSCNGPLPAAQLAGQMTSLRVSLPEAETSDCDLHLDYRARDLVLSLVYHGQLDEAKRALKEFWTTIADESDAAASLIEPEKYWATVIRMTRASSLFDLLEREFPQIEDEYWALRR
jgi:hypothetical protein